MKKASCTMGRSLLWGMAGILITALLNIVFFYYALGVSKGMQHLLTYLARHHLYTLEWLLSENFTIVALCASTGVGIVSTIALYYRATTLLAPDRKEQRLSSLSSLQRLILLLMFVVVVISGYITDYFYHETLDVVPLSRMLPLLWSMSKYIPVLILTAGIGVTIVSRGGKVITFASLPFLALVILPPYLCFFIKRYQENDNWLLIVAVCMKYVLDALTAGLSQAFRVPLVLTLTLYSIACYATYILSFTIA